MDDLKKRSDLVHQSFNSKVLKNSYSFLDNNLIDKQAITHCTGLGVVQPYKLYVQFI